MNQEHWELAWSVYSEASDLHGPTLEQYLRSRSLPPEVSAEVRELLAHRKTEVENPPDMEWSFGPFRIVEALGEGAMGAVYRAEQEGPLRRTVAIKIIRPGLSSHEVLERFEIERRVLALMDHPGIARVYEAGETPAGRPYFAMEYVPGVSITAFSERHSLDTRQRLELLVELCEAIQDAHQKGIIHRDIKPSNVLVTAAGGRAAVKVIDFGVARAVHSGEAATLATQFGSVVGTLAYMSPEQAAFESVADTRSDVYSIGALAYELLTGSPPLELECDARAMPVGGLTAALHRIQHDEPVAPSLRAKAAGRNWKGLAGEVDWVVLKALEKDATRRYQTANALKRDLQRYMAGEAVEAGPPSRIYKLRKMARAYRSLLATAAAFVLVLAVAAGVSMRQAYRATAAEHAALLERDRAREAHREAAAERDRAVRAQESAATERDRAVDAERAAQLQRDIALTERRRADQESSTARAVRDFLQNDLLGQATAVAQANARQTPKRDLKVREALDRAATSIEGKFAEQPAVEAAIRFTIGKTYHDLGLYAPARTQLERALALRRRTLPSDDPDTLETLHTLAAVTRGDAHYPEAERLYRDAYARRARVLGPTHPNTLRSLHGVAICLRPQGKLNEAIRVHEQVLNLRLQTLGEQHPDTMRSLNDLAVAHIYRDGDEKLGLELASKVYELRSRVLGPEHPDTATSQQTYAMGLLTAGQHKRAQQEFERVIPKLERIHGPDHPETINAIGNHAYNFVLMRAYSAATPLQAEKYNRWQRNFGDSHLETLMALKDYSIALLNEGRFSEACELARRSWERLRSVFGMEHAETQRANNLLIQALTGAGRFEDAIQVGQEGVDVRRRVRGVAHSLTQITTMRLADALSHAGRHRESEELLRRAIRERKSTTGAAAELEGALALTLVRQGRFADAEPFARASAARYDEASNSREASAARTLLGVTLTGQGRILEAETIVRASLERLRGYWDTSSAIERQQIEELRTLLGTLAESKRQTR